ncbi:YqcI/YcgG family protein [Heyndrickxia faecalis]|uniref:YqcI/YcgG family protein n=1 Tax=Heyndrickxia TaxID=2837504 RepID=UPI002DCB9632|nr:YqcI/YcgG family protein [Weizmannia sp. CD-2023]MEC2341667.1 YqcI/YcgG family protein [Weizmannia sp. CD-2023]
MYKKTEHQLKTFGEDLFLPFDEKLPKWILIFDKADSMLVFLHPTNEVVLIFGVCRAPFYTGRKSRYTMHGLKITMQPRGTLDDITADTKKGQQVRKLIRERLKNYDSVDLHPDIGNYGDPTNKEWRQYLLPETNDESVIRCPIRRKAKVKS